MQASLEALPAAAGDFERADGPVELDFPADHGAHPDLQTEWWYNTGNCAGRDGERYGFQLTFFRRAVSAPDQRSKRESQPGQRTRYTWRILPSPMWMEGSSTLLNALSAGRRGWRGRPGGPAFASGCMTGSGANRREATTGWLPRKKASRIDWNCRHQGAGAARRQGYSRKGPEAGNASTYISLTRLETVAIWTLNGQKWR